MTVDEFLQNPEPEKEDFEKFESALNEEVMRPLKVRAFPDRPGEFNFQHWLPWLSRDQEARFGSASQWREASSGAEPLLTDSEERSFLVRAILNLIDPEEKKELAHNANLVRARDQLRGRLPILEDRAGTDLEKLRTGLKSSGLSEEFAESLSLEDDLLVPTIKAKLDEKLRGVRALIEEIPSAQDVDKLQASLTRATVARTGLERDLTELEKGLEKLNADWASFSKEKETEEMRKHFESLDIPPGYCGAPISLAEEHRPPCRLWQEWSKLPVDEKTGGLSPEAFNQEMGRRVAQQRSQIEAKKLEVNTAASTETAANKSLGDANEKRHNLFAYLKTQETTFKGLIGLAESAQSAHKEWKTSQTQLGKKDDAIGESYKKQQEIRDKQKGEFFMFSGYFEGICQHVLGRAIHGSVLTRKRLLQLDISDRGPLTSAAIETIKVLALDLAAVWYAAEGKGFHPGFLIHDGPREADMDAWIYRRFFTFVTNLEAAYASDQEPAFQYIITTTEPPPEEMQKGRWLLEPTLSAQKADERLLKTDLT